jgi:HD-GYP domain-containing protein (c-di-GMP phosphodiesterase class II)
VFAELHDSRVSCVQGVLEGMSEQTYASLPMPSRFADSCMAAVERAFKQRNTRLVWEWIDAERLAPQPEAIVECIDLAIQSFSSPASDAGTDEFARQLQRVCRDYVGFAPAAQQQGKREDRDLLIDGISMSIWSFDPDLHEHCEAVSRFAQRIAMYLGLSAGAVSDVASAGRIHEIGKLRAPAAQVRAVLSPDERVAARLQIRNGCRVLQRHPLLTGIGDIVEGAQRVAAGEPHMEFEAKILAAADVFHTLLQDKPYRTALPPMGVIEHLDKRAAVFDREIVDAVIAMCGHRTPVKVSA